MQPEGACKGVPESYSITGGGVGSLGLKKNSTFSIFTCNRASKGPAITLATYYLLIIPVRGLKLAKKRHIAQTLWLCDSLPEKAIASLMQNTPEYARNVCIITF